MPDQERQQQQQQQQHEVGHSGSEEYHYAWDDSKAGKDVPDGGSDSVGTFKDGKCSRWASVLLWTTLAAVSVAVYRNVHNTAWRCTACPAHSVQYLSDRELIRRVNP